MTDLVVASAPSRQQLAAVERSAPGKVTGRLKRAIDAMVWQGLKRGEAAQHAGMTEHSVYSALTRPHVKAYYMQQLDVLRTSERARNIHRLCEIREAANNMPAVQAIDRLMRSDDDATGGSSSAQRAPGVVIQILNSPGSDRQTLVNVSGRDEESQP